MFTPLIRILSLSEIPSLVELPSSLQNLNKLKFLDIRNCINLETLPTGINLPSLEYLYLYGCSRLRSFPNISRNIKRLYLSYTAIEEVPWWIDKFSRLEGLSMRNCNNLRRVSLNILKLKHLEIVDFSNCMALTEASWENSPRVVAITTDNIYSRPPDKAGSSLPDGYISMVQLKFFNSFNFDHKVLFQQQTVLMQVMLSGEEVPSYFTHQSNGTSLTNIPLPQISPSQPFLRIKACALCDVKSLYINGLSFEVQVCFRFVDISGNQFEYVDLQPEFSTSKLGGHLVIFDCCLPLNKDSTPLADQLNYDHVDIQFRLIEEDYALQLKGCGILFPEDGQYQLGNQPCSQNLLPHVCGGNTSNNPYMGSHETEHSQEGSADTLSNVYEVDQDNIVNDGCHETERSDEFVETLRNTKRMRTT